MAKGFSVGQALAVGGGRPSTGGSFIQGLGQGFAAQGPGISKAIQGKREYAGLSERQKLERAANPRDLADIEAFMVAYQDLTEERRATELAKLEKSIDSVSVPLLKWHVRNAGKAPEKTFETEFGKGTPYESQRGAVSKMIAGTTPGKEYQLELGQLPKGERAGALAKRIAPLETRFPDIGKAGALAIPAGEERVLDPVKAARQRAKEATTRGRRLEDVQKALKEMDEKTMGLPWERREVLDAYVEKAVLTEVGAAATATYINDKKVPDWVLEVPEGMWSTLFGIERKEDGTIVNALDEENVKQTITQINARSVFAVDMPVAEIEASFSGDELDMIYAVAFGMRQLSGPDETLFEKPGTRFSADVTDMIKSPVSDFDLTGIEDDEKRQAAFLEYVYSLVVALQGVRAAAAALTLGMDWRMTQAAKT